MQQIIHYFLHFVFPGFIAYYFFKSKWIQVYIIFVLTMLVDLDHIIANPIFDSCRCSIGYHPLHTYPAIAIYIALLMHPKSRVIAIGLLMHMATDYIDCLLVKSNC